MPSFEITIKTLFGLETVLTEELHALGVHQVEPLTRAVRFAGNDEILYRCNLWLRTALSVLKPIDTFYAHHENQLYKRVQRIRWSDYLTPDQTFAIESTTHSELFRHSKYAALKTKDAIADQFRSERGVRPSVDTENPNLLIDLHISDKQVTLSLDSSGNTLDRRGYRLNRTEAPLNEVLAAGLLKLSGWDARSPLLDPLCGSGTIVIEAALMAAGRPPGLERSFSFENWPGIQRDLWAQIRKEYQRAAPPAKPFIFARDADPAAIATAKKNALRAGVAAWIDFGQQNFFDSAAPRENCLLVMNPPYGERLKPETILDFYTKIGDTLKSSYQDCEAWILSANFEALKSIGLRSSKKIKLFNGALECRFQRYELYAGSRKVKA